MKIPPESKIKSISCFAISRSISKLRGNEIQLVTEIFNTYKINPSLLNSHTKIFDRTFRLKFPISTLHRMLHSHAWCVNKIRRDVLRQIPLAFAVKLLTVENPQKKEITLRLNLFQYPTVVHGFAKRFFSPIFNHQNEWNVSLFSFNPHFVNMWTILLRFI